MKPADPVKEGETIRLGPFVVDTGTGELSLDGERVALRPQTAHLLALLAADPGRVVTRHEIRAALWPDDALDHESGINACVRELRRALDDSATAPRFIETVPRRGYRLIPPTPDEAFAAPVHRLRMARSAAALVGLLVLLSLLAYTLRQGGPMSIAVLPVPGADMAAIERLTQVGASRVDAEDANLVLRGPGDVLDGDALVLLHADARIPVDAVLEAGGDGNELHLNLSVAPFDEIAWSGRSTTDPIAVDSLARVLAEALRAVAKNR